MQAKRELIAALSAAKEDFGKMIACPLCPNEADARLIKRHFRKAHKMEKVTTAVVNLMPEAERILYRLLHNKKSRFKCSFCNATFERIALWLQHLGADHRIEMARETIAHPIDFLIQTLEEEVNSVPAPRRRILIQTPQEATPL